MCVHRMRVYVYNIHHVVVFVAVLLLFLVSNWDPPRIPGCCAYIYNVLKEKKNQKKIHLPNGMPHTTTHTHLIAASRDAVKCTSSSMLKTNEMKREDHNNNHTTMLSSTNGARHWRRQKQYACLRPNEYVFPNEQYNKKKMKK